jgi:hypothetical protein
LINGKGIGSGLYSVGVRILTILRLFVSVLGADMRAWNQVITRAADGHCIGRLTDGFVLIGSPEAEVITRLAFGYHKADGEIEECDMPGSG